MPPRNEGGEVLQITNLTKAFGDKRAVDNVTISVERPCMFGIIGASGAGKSTLLRMVNRLADPTEGQILFQNKNKNITRLSGALRWAMSANSCTLCPACRRWT
jgi:phosphonate transport system ATP-binding protein